MRKRKDRVDSLGSCGMEIFDLDTGHGKRMTKG
jgi:hypothetical protein